MQLDRDGAHHLPAALAEADQAALEAALAGLPLRPGVRLSGLPALQRLLAADGVIGSHAGTGFRPVRALLFDKTPTANWALGWHQDRTIAVRARVEAPGFGPWTLKSGMIHVEPPFEILERMLTLRIHLDPVGPGNAPLLVAPGSHRLGRIAERDIAATVERLGTRPCLAARGDIWRYATLILHASHAAATPTARRALQIDYSRDALPDGLEWLGV